MICRSVSVLAVLLFFVSCSKEIRVIKNPNAKLSPSSSPSTNFALITSDPEMEAGISLPDRNYYSINTDGLEQDVSVEGGGSMEGSYVHSVIPTKGGLIVGMEFFNMDSPPSSRIYYLSGGKTLKLISDNNRLNPYYPDLWEGYKEASQNKIYFCSQNAVMMWDESKKELSSIQEVEEEEYCMGRQVDDQFYFSLSKDFETEEDSGTIVRMGVAKPSASGSSVEILDEIELEEYEDLWISEIAGIGNKILFTLHYENYDSDQSGVQLISYDKVTGEDDTLVDEIAEGTTMQLNILNNGRLFNGKVLVRFDEQEEIAPVSLYTDDEEEEFVTTVSNVTHTEFISTDGATVNSIASVEGQPITYVDLLNSEDQLFIIKRQTKFYSGEDYPYSHTAASLHSANDDMDLVHDFDLDHRSNLNIHRIQGKHVVVVSSPIEDMLEEKVSVYLLPNSERGLIEDTRFAERSFRYIMFLNFYDKVLFQGEYSDSEGRSPVSGFFGSDGIIKMIDKLNAMISLFFT